MTPELRSALDNAYDVFARYKYTHDLILSPGKSYHLRSLTFDDWLQMDADNDMGVQLYPYKGHDLFRHFLPRWLEWLSEDSSERNYLSNWGFFDLAIRLGRAKWQTWPAPESAALREVFLSWTRELLAQHSSEIPIDFLSEIGEDLAPYLELWLDKNLLGVSRWLWRINWADAKGAREWLTTSRLESELEAAFFADAEGPNAELFSRSIELIRSLRAL